MRTAKSFARFAVFSVIAAGAACSLAGQQAEKRAITFDDLVGMQRVSGAQVSRDGRWVAYTLTAPNLEANRNESNIWMVATTGGTPVQLTRSGHDLSPQWSPEGKTIAFLSSRAGSTQVYLLSTEGGEPAPLTHLSAGADLVKWSPDGKLLAFTSSVYPDCKDDACNSARDAEREKNKVKARIYDHLLFRHWTHWSEGKRSHLFVIPADGSAAPRDLTAGADYDVPPDERGGPEDIAFSPDGKEICFTAVTDKMEAISTNGDLFLVAVSGGEPRRITTTNPGFDGNPVYSPDGRFIAYHAQFTPEYESDRWRVMLYNRQTHNHENLSERFDRSAMNLAWSADSKTLYFAAEDLGQVAVYSMAATGAEPKAILTDGANGSVSFSGDGRTMVFTRTTLTMPAEIFAASSDGSGVRQITHHNDARLAALDLNPPEAFWFDGAEGAKVEGMLVRPPHFDASKKYPMLLLIHGGPQNMWTNAWSYRWNPEVFAAPGYVAVMINPRGSTGYGQRFTDEIRDDWGGRAYQDLMKGVDFVVGKYPFVDGLRMAAAGGSFGGYMVNWMATHTDRFKVFISHAGIFDKMAMYGSTEELWFEEHDMAGTPWTNPESYAKWSPLTYAGDLAKYKTPTLVICGERDFRVPYTQALEFFTALQRQGVPSELVVYPDEGHWILKPQNSQLWHKTFLDWLATYLK
ncbi:MAG TPA: S9 family peptidase [Candidatus Acidoferrales bacterium]|nr:S9 family peptidase [Candidatus Acidoferrales bacterium]